MFEDVTEIEPDDPNEKPLHFFYNREERIAKAPENVKAYYRGEMKPVRGFKVFFLPQNRWIFFALVFFVGAIWVYTGFNKTRAYANVKGINFELSAFSYEEKIYTSILVKRSKKSKDTNPVNIRAEFFVIDPNNNVGDKQTQSLVYAEGEDYIRVKFTDFDIIRVDVILTVDGEEKELSAEVKR